MPVVKLKRPDGAVCHWCGTEGWIRTCNRCGFKTCDECWKPHNRDSFKMFEPRFYGVYEEPVDA